MKLANLAEPVKAAYRRAGIDTATAEAFASVPPDRQLEVWQEVAGNPQHAAEGFALSAQHVRNVIAHGWIDSSAATFDVSKLPEGTVSRDLFAERVLIERKAFMEAQAEALVAERQKLIDDGWSEVVVGPQADVQDRLYSMSDAPQEYDEQTAAQLKKLAEKRSKLEAKFAELDDDNDPDNSKADALSAKLEALDEEEQTLTMQAAVQYAEATKAVGTAFLLLDPDGWVRREYRIPRSLHNPTGNGNGYSGMGAAPKPPTSDELHDTQIATTFTHQALAVREALLSDHARRKRVLALILHEKVRSEALSVRHEANGTTVHASHAEGFTSAALTRLREKRAELDPLHEKHYVEDEAAYDAIKGLSDRKLDALVDLLTVECVMAHPMRKTALVCRLAEELGVEVRRYWRPDERWLSGYQKIQLAHLIQELLGPGFSRAAEKKKSELVSELAKLFADAAEGRMEDAKLAAKLNEWLPANLRDEPHADANSQASAA